MKLHFELYNYIITFLKMYFLTTQFLRVSTVNCNGISIKQSHNKQLHSFIMNENILIHSTSNKGWDAQSVDKDIVLLIRIGEKFSNNV